MSNGEAFKRSEARLVAAAKMIDLSLDDPKFDDVINEFYQAYKNEFGRPIKGLTLEDYRKHYIASQRATEEFFRESGIEL